MIVEHALKAEGMPEIDIKLGHPFRFLNFEHIQDMLAYDQW